MLELRYSLFGQVSGEVQLHLHQIDTFNSCPQHPLALQPLWRVSTQHLEEWLPSLAQVLASHHLFQIPGPSCLPTCAWNPLLSPAPLDRDLFNKCNILLVEILPLGEHFSAGGCCPSLGLIAKWMKKHMEMRQMEKELNYPLCSFHIVSRAALEVLLKPKAFCSCH